MMLHQEYSYQLIASPIMALTLLFLITACSTDERANQSHEFNALFSESDGLQTGDKVRHGGVPVGEVSSNPEIMGDGSGVAVPIRIDGLPSELIPRLNEHIGLTIEQGRGSTARPYVRLRLSAKDGRQLQNDDIVRGLNNRMELTVWQATHLSPFEDHDWPVTRIVGLMFRMDRNQVGIATYWFNYLTFLATVLVFLAICLDAIMRMMTDKGQARRSPRLLHRTWQFFFAITLVRVFAIALLVSASLLEFSLPDLSPYVIFPADPVELLRWEWRFLFVAAVIFALKYHFGLLAFALQRARGPMG